MKYVTRALENLWGIYACAVFLICALIALIAVTVLPFAGARRRFVTGCCRAPFVLSGVPVVRQGFENLPGSHCVIVANHTSYVDGFLLKGYLPARFSFVIKGEMRAIPVVHFLLRRSGSRFVDRFTAAGSTRDARQIVRAARDGQSLAFFPEGTFVVEPGVGRFRPGAFVAATRGELPLVPAAITGTREMLPAGRALPRPRRLGIRILPPFEPGDCAYDDHRVLAEKARGRIIDAAGEIDRLNSTPG